MKKNLLIIPMLALIFGCHDYKADIDKLQNEKQALVQESGYKDSSIVSFISQFNEVEKNLSMIEKKQASISETPITNELKGTQIQRINDNIREITDLMNENKAKIASLTKKLKSSNVKIAEFEKMIANLNNQLGEKDKQLADLNAKLTSLNTTVEKLNTDVGSLTAENSERQKMIEVQTTKLHTVYYATGTFKELESKQVVSKEGGFLGMGKEKKLKQDFNNEAFNAIDMTKTLNIPIDAKGAVVLTNHPTNSYILEHKGQEVSNLNITDPEKFWKASKYLVVVVDK